MIRSHERRINYKHLSSSIPFYGFHFFQEPVFLWGRTRKSGNDDIVALGMEYNRFSTLGLEFGVS